MKEDWIAGHASLLRPLYDATTHANYGRAALSIYARASGYSQPAGGYSIGGFVTKGPEQEWFIGAINGNIQDAARTKVARQVPQHVVSQWASDQAKLIDKTKFELSELFFAAKAIYRLGGDPSDLPYCYCGGQFVSLKSLLDIIGRHRALYMPLNTGYRNEFELIGVSEIKMSEMYKTPIENLAVAEWKLTRDNLLSEEEGTMILEQGGGQIQLGQIEQVRSTVEHAMKITRDVWGEETALFIERVQLYNVDFFRPPAS